MKSLLHSNSAPGFVCLLESMCHLLSASSLSRKFYAGRHAKVHNGDIVRDILHGIVDDHTPGDATAGEVHVQADVLDGILVAKLKELGHKDIGSFLVDALVKEDDTVLKEAGDGVLLGSVVVDNGHPHRATD